MKIFIHQEKTGSNKMKMKKEKTDRNKLNEMKIHAHNK